MNTTKKWLTLCVGLFALLLVISGCGNKGTESKDGKTIVTYGIWDKQQAPVFQELADEFQKENPDIEIKIEVTPWGEYWTKLETAVTGKNAPDAFWMNIPRAVDYIDNGVLEPLDDVKIDKDKFAQQYIETYSDDKGTLYGIPKDFDTNGLWYNKKIFDEAGVEYPDDTWTWDTWKEAAKKLTNKEAGVYGMAVPPTWQGGYYETIYQNEGEPFVTKDGKTVSGFDDKNTIEGVQFWYDFVKDGSGTPIEVITATNQGELLLSGKVAMAVDGSYQTPVFLGEEYGLENIDVAPIPKGKKRATTSNSLANVVYANSKNKEAAKKWIEFISTKSAMEKVAESGVVIPVYDGAAESWVQSYPDKNLQVFVDAKDYAVPLPGAKNSSAATALEQDSINEVWSGKITIEEACKEIKKNADDTLNK